MRAEARTRRAAIPPDERVAASGAACRALVALLPSEGWVMTYAAMGDELDLGSVNDRLAAAGRLVLPRVEGRRLAAVPAGSGERLVRSSFGVAEPCGAELPATALAAVIVPGLAFDARGYRIGYGAGFYDRFLPLVDPHAATIGVCFAAQVVGRVPVDAHDVAVGIVLTEAGPLVDVH